MKSRILSACLTLSMLLSLFTVLTVTAGAVDAEKHEQTKYLFYGQQLDKVIEKLDVLDTMGKPLKSMEVIDGTLPAGVNVKADIAEPYLTGIPTEIGESEFTIRCVRCDLSVVELTVHVTVLSGEFRDSWEFLSLDVNAPVKKTGFRLDTQGRAIGSVQMYSELPLGMDWGFKDGWVYYEGTPTVTGANMFDVTCIMNDYSVLDHHVRMLVGYQNVESETSLTVWKGEAMKPAALELNRKDRKPSIVELVSGELPEGLELKTGNGVPVIQGTPEMTGTYTATLKCVYADMTLDTHTVTIQVERNPNDPFPFTDIEEIDWSIHWIRQAYEMGLIDGMSPTRFGPLEDLTHAQAVALAARMNQKYETGAVTLKNGTDHWYDTYVDYCREKGILLEDWSDCMDQIIYRQTYADLFSRALPESELAERNTIPDGSLPDVPMDSPYADGIYRLYRAGILNGVKQDGTFYPETNIQRREVAAILVRMMDADTRVDAPSDLKMD